MLGRFINLGRIRRLFCTYLPYILIAYLGFLLYPMWFQFVRLEYNEPAYASAIVWLVFGFAICVARGKDRLTLREIFSPYKLENVGNALTLTLTIVAGVGSAYFEAPWLAAISWVFLIGYFFNVGNSNASGESPLLGWAVLGLIGVPPTPLLNLGSLQIAGRLFPQLLPVADGAGIYLSVQQDLVTFADPNWSIAWHPTTIFSGYLLVAAVSTYVAVRQPRLVDLILTPLVAAFCAGTLPVIRFLFASRLVATSPNSLKFWTEWKFDFVTLVLASFLFLTILLFLRFFLSPIILIASRALPTNAFVDAWNDFTVSTREQYRRSPWAQIPKLVQQSSTLERTDRKQPPSEVKAALLRFVGLWQRDHWALRSKFHGRTCVQTGEKIWNFLSSYFISRPFVHLVLPSFLAFMFTSYLWPLRVAGTAVKIDDVYTARLNDAVKEKDFEAADVYLTRFESRHPTNAGPRLQLALTKLNGGMKEEGEAMLRMLAPSDHLSVPRAHLILALDLANYPEKHEEAEKQFRFAVAGAPSNLLVRVSYFDFLLRTQRIFEATKELEQVRRVLNGMAATRDFSRPGIQMESVDSIRRDVKGGNAEAEELSRSADQNKENGTEQVGEIENALATEEERIIVLSEELDLVMSSKDSKELQLHKNLVRMLVGKGQYALASATLDSASKHTPKHADFFKDLIIKIDVAWARKFDSNNPVYLSRLQHAASLDPSHPMLIDECVNIFKKAGKNPKGEVDKLAAKVLLNVIQSGKSTPEIDSVVGQYALDLGDFINGERLLSSALKGGVKTKKVLVGIAKCIYARDAERVLESIRYLDEAILLDPNDMVLFTQRTELAMRHGLPIDLPNTASPTGD